jgi:hypothetical protein
MLKSLLCLVNGRDMFGFIFKKLQAACDVANLES